MKNYREMDTAQIAYTAYCTAAAITPVPWEMLDPKFKDAWREAAFMVMKYGWRDSASPPAKPGDGASIH